MRRSRTFKFFIFWFGGVVFFCFLVGDVGTAARAALRWLCGLGFGRHGRQCVVVSIIYLDIVVNGDVFGSSFTIHTRRSMPII